jgi:putative transposase
MQEKDTAKSKKHYELRSTRHAKYILHAHCIFTPKYRKKIFTKEHLEDMEIIFSDICKKFDGELIELNGEKDHVHLLVVYPPRIAISVLVNSLKCVSSRLLRKKYPIFQKEYWGKSALWSRSYFVASVGGAPIEILKQYIENQDRPD